MSAIRKARAVSSVRAALLDLLDVLREEQGEHIDGVAADLSITDMNEFEATFAGLRGDLVLMQETL